MKKTKNTFMIVYIIVFALFSVLTALFYILRPYAFIMDFIGKRALLVRSFFGFLTAPIPFSLAEVLITLAAAVLFILIIKTIIELIRGRKKRRKILKRCGLSLIMAAMIVQCCMVWLWGTAYFETGFAEKNGIAAAGVTQDALLSTARLFLDNANRCAALVPRDLSGGFAAHWRDIFAQSEFIYDNQPFDGLGGAQYMPKPMMYSNIMSRTGYTGIYIALTGEANINIEAPACLIPATVAHELAHQRGVAGEAQANFIAVVVSTGSGSAVYEYSGYLMGLIHLMNALYDTDREAWNNLRREFCPELERDWTDNQNYWREQEPDTGLGGAVTAFYDGYLKSNGLEHGVKSYGMCVDLLVAWF